jgi:hypothetical protein
MSEPFFLPPIERGRPEDPELPAHAPPSLAPAEPVAPRAEVVLTRQARRDGKHVAVLKLVRHEHGAHVEAQVFPRGGDHERRAGPYRFSTLIEASNFLTDAVDSLTYLGCEID